MTVRVAPEETRPARLATLPKLPIFLDLTGKRVVIAGGGDAAAWKAELLAATGALVTVYADEICPELTSLIEAGRSIAWVPRRWRASDLDHAWLGLSDGGNAAEIAEFSAAARSRGVLVNVIDQPDACDFQFGTIINRAPVVIGISTDGAAPILGQAIRRRIEAILPASIGAWAAAAKQFRQRLKEIIPSRNRRRGFWERFIDVTFVSQSDEDERLETLERIARDIAADRAPQPPGEIVIVGAGPGDRELLTMKAVRELQAADVIVYDRLVSVDVLELGRREAKRVLVGKKGHGAACSQEDINALLVSLSRDGQRVVRLKGGDPSVFGRTSEEVDACRTAGVPVRIVPGVTTASAAAASLGVSLTRRGATNRVQFVTGHDLRGEIPKDLDLRAIADPHATTVVYMARRTIGTLARRMIGGGASEATPVAVASQVSTPRETWEFTTLGEISAGLNESTDPTIILIGVRGDGP